MSVVRWRRAAALDYDGTMAVGGKAVDSVMAMLSGALPPDLMRVIATGRSLQSLRSSWEEPWPADFLIFSSGSGIYDCRSGEIIWTRLLTPELTRKACLLLEKEEVDYMVHFPIPENHRFYYRRKQGHPDFERRIVHYAPYALEYEEIGTDSFTATQLLAIGDVSQLYPGVFERLGPDFAVIRATSPLDGASVWMELFHPGVDKGSALARLCGDYGIDREAVIAVGNDYNDLHMLEWAGSAAVVSGSPGPLLERYSVCGEAASGGAADAVFSWLGRRI